MKVKALTSFSGLTLSMYEGEVKEVTEKSLLDDLIKANLVEKVATTTKKAVVKDENK